MEGNILIVDDEKEIALTPIEFSILWYLCGQRGNVISSEDLFERVWGEAYIDNNNTVMAHIGRLREKLKEPAREEKQKRDSSQYRQMRMTIFFRTMLLLFADLVLLYIFVDAFCGDGLRTRWLDFWTVCFSRIITEHWTFISRCFETIWNGLWYSPCWQYFLPACGSI